MAASGRSSVGICLTLAAMPCTLAVIFCAISVMSFTLSDTYRLMAVFGCDMVVMFLPMAVIPIVSDDIMC